MGFTCDYRQKRNSTESSQVVDNEEVEFEYLPGVKDNWSPKRFRSFYWLNVICPRFDEIRVELGLAPNSDGLYHVTIGSIENETNRETYKKLWQ